MPLSKPGEPLGVDRGRGHLGVRSVRSIAEIGRARWDAVANPGWRSHRPLSEEQSSDAEPYNPFLSFDFLESLERSGSADASTGWAPRHLVLEEDGDLVGAMPLYLKSHSMGEYVFDHGWADAYQRTGGRYYPKLQSSVPFTPAAGRRLLCAPGPLAKELKQRLATTAKELALAARLSSVHITFMAEDDWDISADLGYLKRSDQQFQFVNPGYRDFDDFLDGLVSRKRKALRRERRQAISPGLAVDLLTGSDLTETAWDAFFDFYMDTGNRKWGRPYLNRQFFSLIGETMPDRILLMMARQGHRFVAGALNFIGSDTLYGRYWGAAEHHPFLHFELCYYQAIDWAIEHRLVRVEAGAQGEHKLARGYVPTLTRSAHWIADEGFRGAVDRHLGQERLQSAIEADILSQHTPFRHDLG